MPRSTAAGGAGASAAPALYDEFATMDAWERFVAGFGGRADRSPSVRSLIEGSWRRSRERGVDPGGDAAPINDDREELRHIARKNAELMAAAQPPSPR